MDNLNYDYIFIDEISMVKEIFYQFLNMIMIKYPNTKFIIVGHFNQLKLVNDRINVINKNCLPLFELCNGDGLTLTSRRRLMISYSICVNLKIL